MRRLKPIGRLKEMRRNSREFYAELLRGGYQAREPGPDTPPKGVADSVPEGFINPLAWKRSDK